MLLEILQTKLFLGWGWIAISSRMDVENLEEFGVYGRGAPEPRAFFRLSERAGSGTSRGVVRGAVYLRGRALSG